MTLREQFRCVFGTLWRVLRVNPLRVYGLVYYGTVGRRDEAMRHRVERWLDDADADR